MRCYEMQNGGETLERLTKHQFRHVLLYNALPFIGFGFLDNAIMICAGEYIDYTFGTLLSISTMAAAALGNLVSDLFGVGLAGYVELLATRVGVSVPDITPAQHDSREARWASAAGRAIGVSIGCIIGMFPLLFFVDEKDDEEEPCNHPDHKASANQQSTKT